MNKNKAAILHGDYPQWLNDVARKLVWRVHRQDQQWREPFKDDDDYNAYLFDIKRDLHEMVSETLRRQGLSI